MSEINDADDLRGMLPYEIIAVVKQLEAERDAATARAEALEAGLLHVLTTRRFDVQCEACRQIRALLGPEVPTTGREGEGTS